MAQAPLQPLQDNLESQTYETFERDSVKYDTYQAAVAAALRDRVPDSEAAASETVLMVLHPRVSFTAYRGFVTGGFTHFSEDAA